MSIPRRLIVNADGFGFGPGATQGILDALKKGEFISSVSVNANFSEVERLRELVSEFPQISVGVHLNPLVGGPCLPVSRVPSLVDSDGCFHAGNFRRLLRGGKISKDELAAEFDAQIGRVRELVGDRLTHLDSQANSHLSYFNLFLAIAAKWGLKRMRNNASMICLEALRPTLARLKVYMLKPHVWLAHQYRRRQMRKARSAGMRMADNLVTVGYADGGNKTDFNNWLRILRNLPPGTHEIYCHPAYPDDTIRRWSYYSDERARELEILRRPDLHDAASELGVEIISFDSI